ncbi:hypothetical protein KMZ27_04940 [Pseudomonas shirazica]|nr:hypothetical protein [Pseudomonas shirazica]
MLAPTTQAAILIQRKNSGFSHPLRLPTYFYNKKIEPFSQIPLKPLILHNNSALIVAMTSNRPINSNRSFRPILGTFYLTWLLVNLSGLMPKPSAQRLSPARHPYQDRVWFKFHAINVTDLNSSAAVGINKVFFVL